MPNRWRLLLAGLLAFVALVSGLAFAFFPVPERLEVLLGLILLVAPIFAAWSLYRWCTKRQPVVPHVPRHQIRRPLALWQVLPWFGLQVGAIGVCAWVWVNDQGPDKPPLGLALLLGTALAIVLTAVPFIINDLIAGQWRLWSSTWRNRKHRMGAIS